MTSRLSVSASRPDAPADYGFSTGPEGMLDWDTVHAAIAAADVYWIGTTRTDGSSQLHSIWAGFVGDRLYFEGGHTTRWARNLAADPRVSFGVESGGLHINGRGSAVDAHTVDDFDALVENYGEKYDYRPEDERFWRVDPSVIIALDMSSMDSFASTPTRFTFEAVA